MNSEFLGELTREECFSSEMGFHFHSFEQIGSVNLKKISPR